MSPFAPLTGCRRDEPQKYILTSMSSLWREVSQPLYYLRRCLRKLMVTGKSTPKVSLEAECHNRGCSREVPRANISTGGRSVRSAREKGYIEDWAMSNVQPLRQTGFCLKRRGMANLLGKSNALCDLDSVLCLSVSP